MIRFAFYVRNLWGRDLPHHDYFYYHRTLTKNKSFETQIYRSSAYNWVKLSIDLCWRGEDHAGPSIELELHKYRVDVKLYDRRHWNYKTGTWKTEEERDND